MLGLRAAGRVSRTLALRSSFRQLRHESTGISNYNTGGGSGGGSSLSHGLVGGLAGGGLVFLGGYAYYHFSGNKSLEVSIGYHTAKLRNTDNLQEQKPS